MSPYPVEQNLVFTVEFVGTLRCGGRLYVAVSCRQNLMLAAEFANALQCGGGGGLCIVVPRLKILALGIESVY